MAMGKIYVYILLIIFGISGLNAFSVSVYIAPSGKDNNPGSKEEPFATLAAALCYVRTLRANQSLTQPVEIIVSEGIYNVDQPLLLTPEDSGTEESPLIIKGNGVNVPVFSGGFRLPVFKRISDTLWETRVPEINKYGGTIQQLFINGKRAVRARTPNQSSFFKTKNVSEVLADTSKQSGLRLAIQKINLTTEQLNALKPAYPEIQNIIISINHAWDQTRKFIQGLSIQDSAIYISGRPMPRWNKLNNTSQFIFENSMAFLDAPGEWFLKQDGTLFYIPLEGETLENTTAIVPVTDQLVIIKGTDNRQVKNIRFENLSFQFSRYLMPFQGNEPAQAAAQTDAAMIIDHAQNIQFQNCEIAHTGTSAIWFRASCSDSKIEHCYFYDLGVGGVKIGELQINGVESSITNNIVIENNIIRSGGREFPTGVGVLVLNASDNTISHNEIADFAYSGISAGWVWGYKYSPTKRNIIACNHIHHLGWGMLSDMGGVYLLGPSEGTVVRNNVIHHIYSYGYGGWGLYLDEGSTGILLENNLVYKCKSSAFHQHYGKENIIRNNIFASQLKAQLEATRIEDHLSFSFTHNIIYFDRGLLIDKQGWGKVNFFADNNLYWNTQTHDLKFGEQSFEQWKETTGKDKYSIIADPMFVNAAGNNFHFKSRTTISKIKFQPFDYTEAGVYGDLAWKKLAAFDPELILRFDKMVEERLNEDEPQINNQ